MSDVTKSYPRRISRQAKPIHSPKLSPKEFLLPKRSPKKISPKLFRELFPPDHSIYERLTTDKMPWVAQSTGQTQFKPRFVVLCQMDDEAQPWADFGHTRDFLRHVMYQTSWIIGNTFMGIFELLPDTKITLDGSSIMLDRCKLVGVSRKLVRVKIVKVAFGMFQDEVDNMEDLYPECSLAVTRWLIHRR